MLILIQCIHHTFKNGFEKCLTNSVLFKLILVSIVHYLKKCKSNHIHICFKILPLPADVPTTREDFKICSRDLKEVSYLLSVNHKNPFHRIVRLAKLFFLLWQYIRQKVGLSSQDCHFTVMLHCRKQNIILLLLEYLIFDLTCTRNVDGHLTSNCFFRQHKWFMTA